MFSWNFRIFGNDFFCGFYAAFELIFWDWIPEYFCSHGAKHLAHITKHACQKRNANSQRIVTRHICNKANKLTLFCCLFVANSRKIGSKSFRSANNCCRCPQKQANSGIHRGLFSHICCLQFPSDSVWQRAHLSFRYTLPTLRVCSRHTPIPIRVPP